MSADGKHALVVIAMLGNVFSPRYARARAKDPLVDPLRFSTMNVALYGPRGSTWALTERGRDAVSMQPDALAIGASSMRWEGNDLVVELSERASPFGGRLGGRIAGRIRVRPRVRLSEEIALDDVGAHRWRPLVPSADVDVEMSSPCASWRGNAYVDSNDGDAALESAFDSWTWSRTPLSGGRVAIAYRATLRDGRETDVSRIVSASGRTAPMESVPWRTLPATAWRLGRHAPSQDGAHVVRTLEDTPFYSRSLVETTIRGERAVSVHESVSLRRFASPWVRMLLPFRMRTEGT